MLDNCTGLFCWLLVFTLMTPKFGAGLKMMLMDVHKVVQRTLPPFGDVKYIQREGEEGRRDGGRGMGEKERGRKGARMEGTEGMGEKGRGRGRERRRRKPGKNGRKDR